MLREHRGHHTCGVAESPVPDDPRPVNGPEPAPAPTPVPPAVVPRWIQLVMLPLAVLGLWALVRAAGPVLLIFVIAGLIALLLNPLVSVLRRAHVPRGLSVLIVYLSVVATLIGLGIVLANPIGDQVSALSNNVPRYVDDANGTLADVQSWLDDQNINVDITDPGETALQTASARLTEGSGSLVRFTRDALAVLVEASIALILVIVLSVYMLLYGERIGAGVRGIIPRGDGTPEDDFPTRIQKAVSGYVRGQLMFSTIMGVSAGVMLWILGSVGIFEDGKRYAVAFGAFYGFAELIPYVGPAVGAFPPVMIAALSPEPLDAVWLMIAFTGLQQIEGHIVAPNVFAQALRINPLLVIFALLMGGQLFGIIGAFIALPIAAMLRETVVYMRSHLVLEPWPTVALAGAGSGITAPLPESLEPPEPPGGVPCAECGTRPPEGAAFCPACGTELPEPGAEAAATSAAPG
jgi:predicted PurR-regulated permease PerM